MRKSQKLETAVASTYSTPMPSGPEKEVVMVSKMSSLITAASCHILVNNPLNSQQAVKNNEECVSTMMGHHMLTEGFGGVQLSTTGHLTNDWLMAA